MSRLLLYTVFHLNLAYSSIEEEQRPEVLRCCYWPLLRLAKQYNLPFGIEASGYTLETAAAIDPAWLDELHRLTNEGLCEFIGSGYAQIIGPLVPAEVNVANLRLGHQAYERLLGFRPQIALVNEQAYSAGLVQHYLDAGYRTIVMEWDNPARYHPEWDPEWRYLPQFACSQHGEEIPLIWNKSIAFQKFQRYAHGEMELDEYLDYLRGHLTETVRAFPLYGNDVEIFDFRPGRYHTEAVLQVGEWRRIGGLFEALLADGRFQFIRPSQVPELMEMPGAGNRLHLESPEQPIPVKKQGKYNITRWAVTGRDDLGINTACWHIYEALKANPEANDDDWRELCYLWSSDFRTHITDARWRQYRERLAASQQGVGVRVPSRAEEGPIALQRSVDLAGNAPIIRREGRYLTVETASVRVRLNCRRGMAIDGLWLGALDGPPLCGTLPHGYYDDIALGADWYTGQVILEASGQSKVTDLNPVEPSVELLKSGDVVIQGAVLTHLGPVVKHVRVSAMEPKLVLGYAFEWETVPIGSFRLGNFTLNPDAFERSTLRYRTHNGGMDADTFPLAGTTVRQGDAISFLVSAGHGIGMTNGVVELGDAERCLWVEVDKTTSALIGLLTYREVSGAYFCRLALSAGEMDETKRPAIREGNIQQVRLVVRSRQAAETRPRRCDRRKCNE